MRDQSELVHVHEVKFARSCVAWGAEFILKCHGEYEDHEYPFQQEEPTGGKELLEIVRGVGIDCTEATLEWNDFVAHCRTEIGRGRGVLFTFPSAVFFDFHNDSSLWWAHMFVAQLEDEKLYFLTRTLGEPIPAGQSEKQLKSIYDQFDTLRLRSEVHVFSFAL